MLHVTRLTDRTGSYYLADLAAELGPALGRAGVPWDPLVGGRPGSAGWWLGDGAAGLGLAGAVGDAELAAVLAGRNPSTGRTLVVRRGGVAGYDLTFAAPKSVSVLWAVGAPEVAREVVAAHVEAAEASMGYVARRALGVRRGTGDERRIEPVSGVVGAAFTHGVSRALDPHLHTHVVVANLGHGPDGRWTTVDGRGLFAHAAAAGGLYDAALRHGLSNRLGVDWTVRRRDAYEVAEIGPGVIGGFSERQAEIRAHLAERAVDGRRASRVAWAATRDPKDLGDPRRRAAALSRRWSARAADLGLGADDLGAVLGRPPPSPAAVDEYRFAARLITSPHAAAGRRDVVGAWAGALSGGAQAIDVERCVDRLADWGDARGVAEPHRSMAGLVPSPHHLRALGPRPSSPEALEVWMDGSAAVDAYRGRWGDTVGLRLLGTERSGRELAAMPARQLADHLVASRRIEEARRRLGRSHGRDPEIPALGLGRG